MNVLITSPRGKEHLVEAFEKAGATVVKEMSSAVSLIIPTVDEELPFFANAKQWMEAKGVRVMVSSPYTVDMVRDKAEFYRFCSRHQFRTPLTVQDNLIAKPRFGKGSRGIIRLDRSYIVQEIIEAPEVSIDYFGDWNGEPVSILPRYRKNIVNGESQAMEAIGGFDVTETARMGKELGLVGHNVIQGFFVNGEMIFTEVNPRFGGGSWMTFPYFNSPQWLMEHI